MSFQRAFNFPKLRRTSIPLRRRFRPRLTFLEDRLAPSNFTVHNVNDSGAGSLRQAIFDADATVGDDAITFDTAVFNVPRTINLLNILPVVSDRLTLSGPGAGLLTVRRDSSAAPFSIFRIGQTTTLSGLTITGGQANSGGGVFVYGNGNVVLLNAIVTGNAADTFNGGGVFLDTSCGLIVRSSTISGNTAPGNGGGVCFNNGGYLLLENSTVANNSCAGAAGGGLNLRNLSGVPANWVVRNSTIAGNSCGGSGGGICFVADNSSRMLTIENSTISGNTASGTSFGGGIFRDTGTATLSSTIVANNSAVFGPDVSGSVTANFSLIRDTSGAFISGANNLPAGTDPQMGSLANNGGSTLTMALAAGSPCVNAGANPSGGFTDQRGAGYSRAAGLPDIGAYEYLPPGSPTATGGPYADITTVGVATYTFQITYADDSAVNIGTLDGNDVRVTGPGSFSQMATFVSVNNPTNGTPRTATYRITAPGGTFTPVANGAYTIAVQPSQVLDTTTNSVPLTPVGTFLMRIPRVVVNSNDSGVGSLRQAMLDANASAADDTIVFDSAIFNVPRTINLLSELPIVIGPGALTLSGPGAGLLTVRRDPGAPAFPVFYFATATTLSGLSVTGGQTTFGGGIHIVGGLGAVLLDVVVTGNAASLSSQSGGGGVFVGAGGSLTVRNSTVSGNTTAGRGGGICFYNGGSLILENSTIAANSSAGHGGGLCLQNTAGQAATWVIRNSTIAGNSLTSDYKVGGGILFLADNVSRILTIENSTITGNTGAFLGGGLYDNNNNGAFGAVTLTSTIIANNSAQFSPDVSGPMTVNFSLIRNPNGASITGSNNLPAGTDPLFEPAGLANNGGPTRTIALQAGSPCVNTGSNPAGLTTDQRGPGFARTSGAGADIGAFEVQAAIAPRVTGTVINDGTAQRSRVSSLTVTFSTQVTFAGAVASAFTLVRTGGGVVTFAASSTTVNGVTVVTLNSFSGSETEFGSLRDGRYSLTALASQISAGGVGLDGNGDGQPGDNYAFGEAQGLYRFFGDINGDRHVDIADFGIFSQSIFNPTNYLAAFDFNNDGHIDIVDFGQFSVRIFTMLP
jgi:Right handed beta helix region/Dockerin type I domain